MSISNLTRYCKYNNFELKNRIAFLSRKTAKFQIIKSYATNLTYDFLDSNFILEPISIEYRENNSYERRFTFSNELKFTIDERYDIFSLIDKFNKNKYYIGIESYLGEWYIVNSETESEWSYQFSLTSSGLICSFTFNTMENYPTVKIDVLPTLKQITLDSECKYVSTEVISLKAIESEEIFLYKDSNGQIKYDLNSSMKDIAFNKDTLEITQTFSNKMYQNELKFNIANDDYNWRYELLEFNQNFYTFIIMLNNNKTIILDKVFPLFNQNNNQSKISFKGLSSSQNLFIADGYEPINTSRFFILDYKGDSFKFRLNNQEFTTNDTMVNIDDLIGKDTTITSLSFFNGDLTQQLTSIDLTNIGDTSNISIFENMFSFCDSLTSINLTNLNTSKASSFYQMFNNCSKLTSINLSSFNTKQVGTMAFMFNGCNALNEINLSNFNTLNLINLNNMFTNCSSLTTLNLSNFNTSNFSNINGLFNGCTSLSEINLDNWILKSSVSYTDLFKNCSSLKTIYLRNSDVQTKTIIEQALEQSNITNVNIITN